MQSYNIDSLSVVLPIYNERENLLPLIEKLQTVLKKIALPYEILLIDDGSTDGTRLLLQELATQNPLLKVVLFKRNFGQTAAMKAGFHYAQGSVILTLDADLQNDPEDFPKLLEKIEEGYDLVSGWRKDRKDHALIRNLPSRLANRLIGKVTKVKLHDYGCSLKAYRADIIKPVQLYGEMHRFLPVYAYWQGAKITEVVVTHHPRQFGKSKYGINRILKVLLDLLLMIFLQKYFSKPIYFFGNFAFYGFIFTFLTFLSWLGLTLGSVYHWYETPLLSLSSIGLAFSLVCLLLGIQAEVLKRTYYESQPKQPFEVAQTINV